MPPILKGSYKRNTCIITELRGDWDLLASQMIHSAF